MEKIDLLLVNPGNRLEQFANLNEFATVAQPLGVALIASFVRDRGYSVAIIDAEVNFWTPEQTIAEIEKYEPMLIGVSAFTTKMTSATKLLELIKERMNVKTVVGGHHVSAIPKQAMKDLNIDYVVQGEGFYPIVELLDRLKHDKVDYDIKGVWTRTCDIICDNGRADLITLDELPLPAYDLLPMDKYRGHHWQTWAYDMKPANFSLVYTSLGCPFSCNYCSVNLVYGKNYTRYRSPEKVVDEIELLVKKYNIRDIEIIDDTFTLNSKRVEEICNLITKRKIEMNAWCFARTDRCDLNLMKLMKKAGINWVFMGLESGDDAVLQGVNKQQSVKSIMESVDIVHRSGINLGGNYVFGLPNDTFQTMQETLDLALEVNAEYSNFFVMMAYPGTELYQEALQKGYPLPERWGQYGFFAPDSLPLRNETLTSKDILTFRDNAFVTYFTSGKYQRLIKNKFGNKALDFLNNKMLKEKIRRV